MVEEEIEGKQRFNQPAGHLEPRESLIEAIEREVLEETARVFRPQFLITVQLWHRSSSDQTFVRFVFTGKVLERSANRPLDREIIACHWLTRQQLEAREHQMRSPLVLESIRAFEKGQRYSLNLLNTMFSQ